jgi:hypothetical protein
MSKQNRNAAEPGITTRHAGSCRHRQTRCTCTPTYRAEAFDADAGKRVYRTFPTITAARRWRQDAYAALRAGTLSADRGPTVREAADDWLTAARAGIVRTRSGDVYKPSAIRGYEQVLRLHVLDVLGHERLREVTLPQLQRFVDRLAADGLGWRRSRRRSRRSARSTGATANSARSTRTRRAGSASRLSIAGRPALPRPRKWRR